jgi:hypothetical protein
MEIKMITDEERINALAEYFEVTDIGDEKLVWGVAINFETLEKDMTFGVKRNIPAPAPSADFRGLIDRLIISKSNVSGDSEPKQPKEIK